MTDRIGQFILAAATLDAANVDQLTAFYATDCEFIDPFQRVQGREKVRAIYADMFAQLHQPCFDNVRLLGQSTGPTPEFIIGWDFKFSLNANSEQKVIAGCSLLRLNDQNEIALHHDYWDASQVMQALPIIGRIIAWLRQKIAHSAST